MVTTIKTKIIDDLFNNYTYSCRTYLGKLVSILFHDMGTVFYSMIDGFNFLRYNSIFHHQLGEGRIQFFAFFETDSICYSTMVLSLLSWGTKRGMIPFYAFRDFLLFHSTTNLASCRHWEKVGFPDFSKICKLCKIPELLWLQPKISY